MSAVSNVAEYCQETYKATVEGRLTRMVILLTDTLESNKTLRVQHIPAIGTEVADAASHTDRPHDCLTAIGMKTRVVLATAIARRFLRRYSSTCLNARTHLFDHTILLSPRFRKMKYIDLLLGSTAAKSCDDLADAPAIKSRIHREVVTLLTKAVVEMRSRATRPSEVEAVTGPQSGTPQAATRDAKRKRSAGLFDDNDSESEAEEEESATSTSPQRSPEEEAKNILKEWLQQEVMVARAVGLGRVLQSYQLLGLGHDLHHHLGMNFFADRYNVRTSIHLVSSVKVCRSPVGKPVQSSS